MKLTLTIVSAWDARTFRQTLPSPMTLTDSFRISTLTTGLCILLLHHSFATLFRKNIRCFVDIILKINLIEQYHWYYHLSLSLPIRLFPQCEKGLPSLHEPSTVAAGPSEPEVKGYGLWHQNTNLLALVLRHVETCSTTGCKKPSQLAASEGSPDVDSKTSFAALLMFLEPLSSDVLTFPTGHKTQHFANQCLGEVQAAFDPYARWSQHGSKVGHHSSFINIEHLRFKTRTLFGPNLHLNVPTVPPGSWIDFTAHHPPSISRLFGFFKGSVQHLFHL